jgi:hypothetical protein
MYEFSAQVADTPSEGDAAISRSDETDAGVQFCWITGNICLIAFIAIYYLFRIDP